jgi:hypothetical protein
VDGEFAAISLADAEFMFAEAAKALGGEMGRAGSI